MIDEQLHDPHRGQCFRCGQTGQTGQPCSSPGCQGLSLIPQEHAVEAQAQAHPRSLVGRIIGEFLVVKPLGKGGFGSVYLALRRPSFMTQGALKLFDPSHTSEQMTPILRRYFTREIKILSSLNEPNIIQLIDDGEHEGCPYLVMRYVGGGTLLREHVWPGVMSEPAFVRTIAVQLMRALKAAHQLGVVHRDLKPENIMLQGEDHHVYVLDFGLAKHVQELHQTVATFGTPYYMAPEQLFPTRPELRDARVHESSPLRSGLADQSGAPGLATPPSSVRVGPACDLYALGVILAEMMTGQALFQSQSAAELAIEKDQRREDPIAPLRALKLPDSIDAFLTRALAYRPSDRFESVEAMRAAFEGCLPDYERFCAAHPERLVRARSQAQPDMSSAAFLSTKGADHEALALAQTSALPHQTPTAPHEREREIERKPGQGSQGQGAPVGRPLALAPLTSRSPLASATQTAQTPVAPPTPRRPGPSGRPGAQDRSPLGADPASSPTTRGDAQDDASDEPIYRYGSTATYVAAALILALLVGLATYLAVRPAPEPLRPEGPVITQYDRELERVRRRVSLLPRWMARGEYARVIEEVKKLDESEARLTPEEHKEVVAMVKVAQRELPHSRRLEEASSRFERAEYEQTLEALGAIPEDSAVWALALRRQLFSTTIDALLKRAYNDVLLRQDEERARSALQAILRHAPEQAEARALLARLDASPGQPSTLGPVVSPQEGAQD